MNAHLLRAFAGVRAHLERGQPDDACRFFAVTFAEFCALEGMEIGADGPSMGMVAKAFDAIGSHEACEQLAAATSLTGKQLAATDKPHVAIGWFALADAMHAALGVRGRFPRAANAIEHGIALRILQRYAEAEDRYELAAHCLPQDAPVQGRLALATASAVLGKETGRRGQAVALLNGLAADPAAMRVPQFAGWVLANLAATEDMPEGRYGRAITRLEQAHALLSRPDGDPARLAEIEHQLALAMSLNGGDARMRELAVSALARTAVRPQAEVAWRCLEFIAWDLWSDKHQDFSIALLKLAADTLLTMQVERAGALPTESDGVRLAGPDFVFDLLALMLTLRGRFGERRVVLDLKLAFRAQGAHPAAGVSTDDERWAIDKLLAALRSQSRRFAPGDLLLAIEQIAEALAGRAATRAAELARLNEQFRAQTMSAMPVASRRDTLVLLCMQTDKEVRVTLEGAGMPIALGPTLSAPYLYTLAHDFVSAITHADIGLRTRLGAELSSMLLAPILAACPPGFRRIVLCAPGPLHGLPWAALPWQGGYLIERFDLVRASGPDVDLCRAPALPLRLLAAGCSVAGAEALPHASVEVACVGAEFALNEPHSFTAARLRSHLPAATILHIATHFEARTAQLAESVLLLGDESCLTLKELTSMGLSHLDLLVLSTCESGVASGTKNAEAFAVDHVLMAGKVPAVIGMLFPVADEAMAEFMRRLYQHLRQGEDKDRALAAVQNEFLSGAAGQRWRAPFFWAGPMLSGNWLGWRNSRPAVRRNRLSLVTPG